MLPDGTELKKSIKIESSLTKEEILGEMELFYRQLMDMHGRELLAIKKGYKREVGPISPYSLDRVYIVKALIERINF